jgi:TonB family protein
MAAVPPPPRRPGNLFIWLFGSAIILLAAYNYVAHSTNWLQAGPKVYQPEPAPQPEPGAPVSPGDFPPSPDSAANRDMVYTYVEQMPQPPGGLPNLLQYLDQQARYPAEARRQRVEGKVFVNFIIRRDGKITDVKVVKGLGYGLDEEAVRVVSQLPAWTPGKQNGQVVNVSYTVPVTFLVKP